MRMRREKNTTRKGIRNLALCVCAIACLGLASMSAHAATGTVTAGSAKIRSTAGTSGEALAGVKQNDTLDVIGKTDGADGAVWYQVYVNGSTKGYIRSDLISVDGDVSAVSPGTADTQEQPQSQTTETAATVTESSADSGTITRASVNVRKGPAATDAIVGNIKQGNVVSITGETTGSDGKPWYQVSFVSNDKNVTGFIRSDLLEVTEAPEEEPTEAPTEAPEEENTQEAELTGDEINRAISSRILPDGVDLAEYPIDESTLQSWQDGQYYLLYMIGKDGSNYWYLYDLENHAYQRADSLSAGEPVEPVDDGGFGTTAKIIVIILAVVIVILIVIITLLALKLRESEWDDDEDEEDEDDDYGRDGHVNSRAWKPRNFLHSSDRDEDDDEEDEDDEDLSRRPVRRAPAGEEPRRRPESGERRQPERPRQGEPARRPAVERQGEPARRAYEEPRQGAPARRPSEEPRRRPEGGERRQPERPRQGEPARRPAGERQGEPARRTAENGERRAPERPRQSEPARRAPENGERRPSERPRQGEPVRRAPEETRRRAESETQKRAPKKSYYEEDDEFEFEFLNMDGKED